MKLLIAGFHKEKQQFLRLNLKKRMSQFVTVRSPFSYHYTECSSGERILSYSLSDARLQAQCWCSQMLTHLLVFREYSCALCWMIDRTLFGIDEAGTITKGNWVVHETNLGSRDRLQNSGSTQSQFQDPSCIVQSHHQIIILSSVRYD